MTGNLIKRLREQAYFADRSAEDAFNEAADLIETQAREIERLGVIAQGNASIVCKILDEKDAEIERLREALARISNLSPAVTHGWAEEARQITRAALAGDSHDQ